MNSDEPQKRISTEVLYQRPPARRASQSISQGLMAIALFQTLVQVSTPNTGEGG